MMKKVVEFMAYLLIAAFISLIIIGIFALAMQIIRTII